MYFLYYWRFTISIEYIILISLLIIDFNFWSVDYVSRTPDHISIGVVSHIVSLSMNKILKSVHNVPVILLKSHKIAFTDLVFRRDIHNAIWVFKPNVSPMLNLLGLRLGCGLRHRLRHGLGHRLGLVSKLAIRFERWKRLGTCTWAWAWTLLKRIHKMLFLLDRLRIFLNFDMIITFLDRVIIEVFIEFLDILLDERVLGFINSFSETWSKLVSSWILIELTTVLFLTIDCLSTYLHLVTR